MARPDLGRAIERPRAPAQKTACLSCASNSCWRSIQNATLVRVGNRGAKAARRKSATPRAIGFLPALAEQLHFQYSDHPHWSYQLHYDNPAASVKANPALGRIPAYSTIKRDMQAHGLVKKPRLRPSERPGETRAERRQQTREIRSYEATHVGALWHVDFHHGSLKVLTPGGQWVRPITLVILDDHSRLCCHVQWYLSETAEDLVHGLSRAIQKRGLPRALLTDNGSAMVADEVTEGLLRLGIVHERTLPYSPYQKTSKVQCEDLGGGWGRRVATRASTQGPRSERAARCRFTAFRDWPKCDKSIHNSFLHRVA